MRPTQREAEDYLRYVEENADWNAVESIMEMKGLNDKTSRGARAHSEGLRTGDGRHAVDRRRIRRQARWRAGRRRPASTASRLSFVNYLDELPLFRDEVLPRLERLALRGAVR